MTSAADALKLTIERWADSVRSSVMKRLAEHERLSPRLVARYLESLRYLFAHSPRNLAQAAEGSRRLGLAALAEYFDAKAREESGHDAWAQADLEKLAAHVRADLHPTPAIVELVEYQSSLITRHPMYYFAYVLWAEYMTVLIGDEWLAILSDCGYTRTQISALSKHVDADRDHAPRGFDELERLWAEADQPPLTELVCAVEQAGSLFMDFCHEIEREQTHAA
jgi:hypothetical protein